MTETADTAAPETVPPETVSAVSRFADVAKARGCTSMQEAIAFYNEIAPAIPIPPFEEGTSKARAAHFAAAAAYLEQRPKKRYLADPFPEAEPAGSASDASTRSALRAALRASKDARDAARTYRPPVREGGPPRPAPSPVQQAAAARLRAIAQELALRPTLPAVNRPEEAVWTDASRPDPLLSAPPQVHRALLTAAIADLKARGKGRSAGAVRLKAADLWREEASRLAEEEAVIP